MSARNHLWRLDVYANLITVRSTVGTGNPATVMIPSYSIQFSLCSEFMGAIQILCCLRQVNEQLLKRVPTMLQLAAL